MTATLDLKTAKALRGECEKCPRLAELNKGLCLRHLGKAASRQRAHRQKLASAGLCRDACGAKVAKRRRPDGTIIPRRCKKCSTKSQAQIQGRREARRGNDHDVGVTPQGADPAPSRWKIESAYDGNPSNTATRFIGRGHRGAPRWDEIVADQRIELRKLIAELQRLDDTSFAKLLSPEVAELGRIQRREACAIVADAVLRVPRVCEAIAEAIAPGRVEELREGE